MVKFYSLLQRLFQSDFAKNDKTQYLGGKMKQNLTRDSGDADILFKIENPF